MPEHSPGLAGKTAIVTGAQQGIGAAIVAVGLLSGLLGPLMELMGGYAPGALLILFGVLSGLAWWALRRAFGRVGPEAETFDRDVND